MSPGLRCFFAFFCLFSSAVFFHFLSFLTSSCLSLLPPSFLSCLSLFFPCSFFHFSLLSLSLAMTRSFTSLSPLCLLSILPSSHSTSLSYLSSFACLFVVWSVCLSLSISPLCLTLLLSVSKRLFFCCAYFILSVSTCVQLSLYVSDDVLFSVWSSVFVYISLCLSLHPHVSGSGLLSVCSSVCVYLSLCLSSTNDPSLHLHRSVHSRTGTHSPGNCLASKRKYRSTWIMTSSLADV